MRKLFKSKITYITVVLSSVIGIANSGNPDRSGAAGAVQLTLNPWAKSAGWNGLNGAGVEGVESMRINVAGIASGEGTEVGFSNSIYLAGSGINMNALGVVQNIGGSALGISLMTINMGDIDITTTNNPEGGLGSFPLNIMNLGISYAKKFTTTIRGGAVIRIINESTTNVNAGALAIDAGFQYVTGKQENIKLGVALRNIGLPMTYRGSGLWSRGQSSESDRDYETSIQTPSAQVELPSLLSISGAYDIIKDSTDYRYTVVTNFISNAFGKDQIGVGAEFAYQEKFMLRASYLYEDGILSASDRTSVRTGVAVGASVELPIDDKNTKVSLDYAYRTTNPFKGIHNMGLRLNF